VLSSNRHIQSARGRRHTGLKRALPPTAPPQARLFAAVCTCEVFDSATSPLCHLRPSSANKENPPPSHPAHARYYGRRPATRTKEIKPLLPPLSPPLLFQIRVNSNRRTKTAEPIQRWSYTAGRRENGQERIQEAASTSDNSGGR
jgi:hypothetical protein